MSASRSGAFLVLASVLSTGCNGVFWGNLGVLCVTVAIFLGTVFLTRSAGNRSATRAAASTSQSARASTQRSVAPARSASTSQHS
jgi:hypothetical protein